MRTPFLVLAASAVLGLSACHRMGPVNHGGGFSSGGAAVDPMRWNELPQPLRPAVLAGEPTSTTTITSAPR